MSFRVLRVFRILRRTTREISKGEGPSALGSLHLLRLGSMGGAYGIAAVLAFLGLQEIYSLLVPPQTELQRYEQIYGSAEGKAKYFSDWKDKETEKDWIGKA